MKYFEVRTLGCAKCLDTLIGTISEDRQFVMYEHVKWYDATYCEDIGTSFKLPILESMGEIKDA